jgi:hypothetical protein
MLRNKKQPRAVAVVRVRFSTLVDHICPMSQSCFQELTFVPNTNRAGGRLLAPASRNFILLQLCLAGYRAVRGYRPVWR